MNKTNKYLQMNGGDDYATGLLGHKKQFHHQQQEER
jgi:hypothetical protein